MAKKHFGQDVCPVARALEVAGDWWSILIVREALRGVRRFSEFSARLGLAKNILSDRLRKLVAHGVLELVPASDGSAYSEYALTDKGRDLFTVLVALRQWADRWIPGSCDETEELVDRERFEPVLPLELHASDGRLLSLPDVALVQKRQATRAS
jgi:DNA-binding HxlR family transcriptional regulator